MLMNKTFIRNSCVLFERSLDGDISTQPFCPRCEQFLTVSIGGFLYCEDCVYFAPINSAQIPGILNKIAGTDHSGGETWSGSEFFEEQSCAH